MRQRETTEDNGRQWETTGDNERTTEDNAGHRFWIVQRTHWTEDLYRTIYRQAVEGNIYIKYIYKVYKCISIYLYKSNKYYNDMSKIFNKFSRKLTSQFERGGSQAMLYALGLNKSDMKKPQIGIGSVWYEGNPCNSKLNELVPWMMSH